MSQPLIFAVIPCYNASPMVWNTLGSMKNMTEYDNLQAIIMNTPASFAENVNRGIMAAMNGHKKPDYILLLNDDMMIVQKEWLRNMVDVMEVAPKLAGVSPRMLFPDGRIQFGGMIFHDDENRRFEAGHYGWGWPGNDPRVLRPREAQATTFGCVLLRASAIESVGLLDEGYIVGGFEDVDWCFTAALKGWRFGYVPQSVIVHAGSLTFNSMEQGLRAEAFRKNRERYHEKWDKYWINGTFEVDDVKYEEGTK